MPHSWIRRRLLKKKPGLEKPGPRRWPAPPLGQTIRLHASSYRAIYRKVRSPQARGAAEEERDTLFYTKQDTESEFGCPSAALDQMHWFIGQLSPELQKDF